MLLTILIPTRNRASLLKRCLQSVVQSLDAANVEQKVRVVVVDNFSEDGTRGVVEEFADRGDVAYRKHTAPAATAEESLCRAIPFADSEYIWSLGDDDVLVENAVERVVRLLSTSSFDFVLLNLFAKAGDQLHTYFRAPYPTVTYERGVDLFRDMGIISATTTISCLCFRKSALTEVDWAGLIKISSIYSHSVSFLLAFHDRPCAFLEDPCVIYTQNTAEDEGRRIFATAKAAGRPALYPFTIGLIRLIREAARRLEMPIAEIAQFEEIELSKSHFMVLNSSTVSFIARMVVQQLVLTIQRPEIPFSPSDLAEILEFFSAAGDGWCLTTVRCAIGVVHATEKRTEERLTILNGYFQELFGIKHTAVASSTSAPGSWRKPFFLYSSGVPFKTGRGIAGDDFGRPIACPDEKKIRLTILIPTYNRARSLARQLRSLHRLGIQDIPEIEILVADNCSNDRTPTLCCAASRLLPALRAIHYDVHLPTAEENVNRAIGQAQGDYVWLLGDDDLLVQPVVFLLLNLLWHRDEPCFVFDNLVSPPSEQKPRKKLVETVQGHRLINQVEPLSRWLLKDMVKRFGLTTGLAFLSRYVVRRSDFRPFDHYIRVSPIYSHVFGLLESFSGKEVTYVNYPLVSRSHSSMGGFERLKRLTQHPFYFPWTIGLVRLAKTAAVRGVVKERFLKEVRELDASGSYELQLEMRIQLIRQCIRYCESGAAVELPEILDVEGFFDYFREEKKEADWTDCCVYLSYLKLARIGAQRGTTRNPPPGLEQELIAIRNILYSSIDKLAKRIPLTVILPQPVQRFPRLRRVTKQLLGRRTSSLLGKAYRKAASLACGLLPSL